ncbi:sporulation protein Cse60 [Paenibacillus jamilae]|uniref:sporulation protein Cse60 n=1 Tax=Paenibacillus jamilae TaxID=114136 RepID=UPI003D28577C
MTQVLVLSEYSEGRLQQGINEFLNGFHKSRLIDIKFSTSMIPDNSDLSITGCTIIYSALIIYEENGQS